MKKYRVGVFSYDGKRKRRYSAYTVWYSPEWDGCREFEVEAVSGAEAKRTAIDLAKREDAELESNQS